MIIKAIIFENGENDLELWSGFQLTKDDHNKTMEILGKYDAEGCSVRGTKADVLEEMEAL